MSAAAVVALDLGFLESPTRFFFFTGKGGVGKTTMACAAALALAERGRRVLLVSTDPASNLDEVLGVPLNGQPTVVPGVAGLEALNIDPEVAARAYRERVVGPYRGVLPDSALRSIEEQLSGACTVEIAAFDEFSRLLGDASITAVFDHILFDTAPTGHTLRLLQLPGAWHTFIETSVGGASCLGPLAGLQSQQALYAASLANLQNAACTRLVLVARPEMASLDEAERARGELAAIGIDHPYLVLNGVFHATARHDGVAMALEVRGSQALARLPAGLACLPRTDIPLSAVTAVGLAGLRALIYPSAVLMPTDWPVWDAQKLLALPELVAALAAPGHGLVMVLGKGGVGKTTMAAVLAMGLVARGCRVHLTTTDPAAHVQATLVSAPAGLTVGRIDPQVETATYAREVLAGARANGLDADGLALLAEDLRSPCTEEIAVFRAFARVVAEGRDGFVVLDTAPTGHTLLLLDATQAYQREIDRTTGDVPESVRSLLSRLRDPHYTQLVMVTLPEATPVHEASALQTDLKRAGMMPCAWIINQSLTPLASQDPVIMCRRALERPWIDRVASELASCAVLVPWQTEPPVGPERLGALALGQAIVSGEMKGSSGHADVISRNPGFQAVADVK